MTYSPQIASTSRHRSLATKHTRLDAWVRAADASLRTLASPARASRPTPVTHGEADPSNLNDSERALSGALMRVNHVGEVCAQALYTAQALGARLWTQSPTLAAHLDRASQEEADHLAWTAERIEQLNTHTSLLNPLWYAGAFGLGLAAAACGRGTSLGFVVETERQVEAHLDEHLSELPVQDHASRAIVSQMKADEMAHARQAQHMGAKPLPAPVQWAMRQAAKVMTTVAHRV